MSGDNAIADQSPYQVTLKISMPIDCPSPSQSAYLPTLVAAVAAWRDGIGDRPKTTTVVTALLVAEKAAKQQRLIYPFQPLLGEWRLCFATGTRKAKGGGITLGRGWYMPRWATARIAFTAATDSPIGEIRNQARLGSLCLTFTGPCQYMGKKNLLAFDFTRMQMSVLGRLLQNRAIRGHKSSIQDFPRQSIAGLPFFAFFLVTEEFIAARGRGGGLAIWIRERNA